MTTDTLAPIDPFLVRRWECHCSPTAVLLGIYDDTGCINIKIRDRYWRITRGAVETICPKCGRPHVLDSARLPEGRAPA